MKIKYLILFLFFTLLTSINLYSQEEDFKELIIDKYISELKLDNTNQIKITSIFLKYKPLFENKSLSNKEYNTLLKREALEVYEILNRSQFSDYKKIKKVIEPNKRYRSKLSK